MADIPPIAHWPMDGSGADASTNEWHASTTDVTWVSGAGAALKGRTAHLEVPAAAALQLGVSDFTVALWMRVDPGFGDASGDLVSWYDPVRRQGFNLGLQDQSGTCTSMANTRNLFFGMDAGTEPRWTDCGRPGNNRMVFALSVHAGDLYAGTFEHGAEEAGRVHRYVGGTDWEDCGAPDRCNTVSALGVFRGQLHAGVARYSGVGSHLAPSPNEAPGGRVYRYAGDRRWEDCGRPAGAEVVWGMTVFQDALHVSVMDLPPRHLTTPRQGVYRYAGGTRWIWCGNPGGRLAPMTVVGGHLFAGGFNGGTLGGVFRYEGGTNWSAWGSPPQVDQTYSFAVHRGVLHAGTWKEGRVYRFSGPGQWEDAGRLGNELEVMGLAHFNGKLYGGTLPLAQVYRQDEAGWTLTGRLDFRRPSIGAPGPPPCTRDAFSAAPFPPATCTPWRPELRSATMLHFRTGGTTSPPRGRPGG